MKTILVTGGTGFIGNCFCKLLLDERLEYKVINVDVCTYAANPSTIEEELKNPNYKFYKTDIRDREEIEKIYGNSVADSVIIQYGGSVKSSNAKELFEMSDIDGGLVGGASLKADEFAKIVNYK